MAKQTRAQQIRQERWPEIRERFENGESYPAIAKDVGVSSATMLKWLIEEGYKYRTKGRYPRAMRRRAKEMVERGDWEIEDVAEILKVDKKLVAKWYASKEPDKPHRKKNPAPRRNQLSPQAQRLIKDPRVPRHKRGRRWELEQKRFVVQLIRKRFSIIEVYRIMGASKARQSKIWKELVGRDSTPPNFPTEEGPRRVRRALPESPGQRKRRALQEARTFRRREARDRLKERRKVRRKALHERRHKAIKAPEEPPALPPAGEPPALPPAPVAVPPPGPEETRAFVEPEMVPPSRQTALPRPPWERKKKKKPKKKKKRRRRSGRK